MDEIVSLVLAKRVRPVVGKVVDFAEIPAAIDAMARRESVGRTVALVSE
jgi:NADPH:quinone reductase-like Zn-dependent oxidoreductase